MNTKSNQKDKKLSRDEFEFILNGANWSEPEATLKIWVCPCSPSLKKCAGCNKTKKHVMSSSLRGGAWGVVLGWIIAAIVPFKRLEELRISGFLKETRLLLEVEQSIDNYSLLWSLN